MLDRQPLYLLTFFGTIVCQENGQFVHRPLARTMEGNGPAQFNVVDTSLRSATSLGDQFLQIRTGLYSGVSLLRNGRFLSAKEEGSMAVDRAEAGGWEVFLLLSKADLNRLLFFVENSWIIVATKKIVRSMEIKLLDHFRIDLGGTEFDLRYNMPMTPIDGEWGSSGDVPAGFRTCTLWRDSWVMAELSLYRPIVYYCAFGMRSLEMCASSLWSLQQLGDYTGDVLIMTNVDAATIRERIPFWPADKLHVLTMLAHGFLDFSVSRYRIAEWVQAAGFQPLLYVDTDVAFDLDPTPMLVDVLLSRKMSAQREPYTLISHAPIGAQLFEEAAVDPGDAMGFCSGIIGISSVVEHGTALRQIVEMSYRYASFKGSRGALSHFDQAIANFVGFMAGSFDLDVCTPYIRYVEFDNNWRGGDHPMGLAHIWGVADKQVALDDYVASLSPPDRKRGIGSSPATGEC